MPCQRSDTDPTASKCEAVIYASTQTNQSNREAGRKLHVNESMIRNFKKRVCEEAEKEKIPSVDVVNDKLSRGHRDFKLDVRDCRRLVRHATKNKVNRRKARSVIAQECGIVASMTTI